MSRTSRILVSLIVGVLVAASREQLHFVGERGEPVVLSTPAAGRTVIVHFWASWCPSCPEDMRQLQAEFGRCDGGLVRVLTANVGEDRETVTRFVAEMGLKLPVLRDPSGSTWRGTGALGLPSNLVWGPEGRRIEVGPKDAAAWRKTLDGAGCRPAAPETESTRRFEGRQRGRGKRAAA